MTDRSSLNSWEESKLSAEECDIVEESSGEQIRARKQIRAYGGCLGFWRRRRTW